MNEAVVNKCPKCGGEMIEAKRLVAQTRLLADISLAKMGDMVGDKMAPYYCKTCGYIELYKIPPHSTPLPPSFLKKCIKCGEEIPIAAEECSYCGAKQP